MFTLRIDDDVCLQLLEERDAAELFGVTERNRGHLRRWLPWLDAVTQVEHSRAFIRATLAQFAQGNGFRAGLRCRGQLAGMLGLHYIDWGQRSTSLGYWLAESFQGRGVMTRACAAVLDHVFGELGLNHAEIRCAPGNRRSRGIPERLGFLMEGVLRQREWLYDHHVDHVVYGMLAADWKARRAAGAEVACSGPRGDSVAVRPYAAADEEAVVRLWHTCGLVVPWNDPKREIETKLRFQPDLLLVALCEGRIAGTAMAGYDGHRGWINYVAVAPERRRRGIGRLLMEEAERRLAALGCPKVNLQVRAQNREVMAFYRHLGYEAADLVSLGKRLARGEGTNER